MTEFVVFLLVIFAIYEAAKRRGTERELSEHLARLQRYLDELELRVRELHPRNQPTITAAPPGHTAPEAASTETVITHVPPEKAASREVALAALIPKEVPTAPAAAPVPQHLAPATASPVQQPPRVAASSQPTPPPPAARFQPTRPATPLSEFEPAVLQTAAATTRAATPKHGISLEERLGANWLSKVGIVLLVLGVVSFLIYQFGGTPSGKVFLGYAGALLALGWGVWLDRNPNYKVFARSCIGGGWSLLYFTTFAMNHVAAAHVLDSEAVDLVLMLLVAGGMVAHSLRYRSQAATALAFLLGFTAISISHTDISGLVANVVLAMALAVIAVRLRWFEMEIIGIAAAYGTHLLWLMPLIERGTRPIPGADMSVAILIAYWVIFRASYVVRQVPGTRQESLSTASALLNSFALLAMLKYQAAHPELAFWALLGFGVVEVALGQLPLIRRRRRAFLVLTTIGVALVIAAIPFRYGGPTLAILWLFCSQALVFIGVFTREIHFRRLGELAAVVACATIFYEGAAASHSLAAGLVFGTAALLFWIDGELVTRRWATLIHSDFERGIMRLLSYLAAAAAAMAAWVALPAAWIPVAWAATAAVVVAVGQGWQGEDLLTESSLLMLASSAYVLLVHIAQTTGIAMAKSTRLLTAVLVAAAAYAIAPWSRILATRVRPLISTSATLIVFLLIWRESNPSWVGVGWVAMALALAAVARNRRYREFAVQAHWAAVAAFIYAVLVNLPSAAMYQHAQVRLITAATIAIALYAVARMSRFEPMPLLKEIGPLHTWGASTLIAVLAWYELAAVAVVPAWTVFGVALFEAGMLWRSRQLRLQSYCVLMAAFTRMWFVNLQATEPLRFGLSPRIYTLIPLAAAFVYCYVRLTSPEPALGGRDLKSLTPPLTAWLATSTIAALLRFEVADPWVITAWGVLAIAVLLTAWVFARRVFVYQAIVLALAVLGRGVFYNIGERSNFASTDGVLLTVGVAACVLFASLIVAFRLRATAPAGDGFVHAVQVIASHPEQVIFFISVVLVTLMLGFGIESGGPLTVAWGIEGVVLFVFALLVGERSFRLTGLVLLLGCVAKIVFFDIWGHHVGDRQRYLTLIVIGAALLLVSFLYNRNRERVRQLL